MTSKDITLPDIVRAPRTDAIYACHSYLTKLPVAAIVPFIEGLTRPGDVVVDPFAGSGMTGIAAHLSGREAVLSDISVLGRHVAMGYLVGVEPESLRATAAAVVARARAAIEDLYVTRRIDDGHATEMVRTVWSFTYICPRCAEEILYFDWVTSESGKSGTGKHEPCPGCASPFERRRWTRGRDIPVQVIVRSSSGRLAPQPVQEIDDEAIRRAAVDPRLDGVPNLEISDRREMYKRSALAKHGLTETRRFFAPRNALALFELWHAIGALDAAPVRHKLAFAFTAILPRASRRYQWSQQRPLNAQNQTYYIAPVHFEWNVFELFLRKVEAVIRSDRLIIDRSEGDAGAVRYQLTSADTLTHLADESVDYVFTDPPFGSNIFYSDMHLFHEAWLGEVTNAQQEAVVRTLGIARADRGASARRYESLLAGAFAETARVLKPGRFLSVVYGNSKGELWALLLRSLCDAGFDPVPAHVAILDKGQRSVKGLTSGSERVVTVDLVLTFQKRGGRCQQRDEGKKEALGHDLDGLLNDAAAALNEEQAKNPSYLYVGALREAIRRGLPVDELRLGDILSALESAGYSLDPRSGLLDRPVQAEGDGLATTTRGG